MEPNDYVEHKDENGRVYFSALVHWRNPGGPAHCLMQAVFLPGSQLKIFLPQLKTCPRFQGIYHDPADAANAAWRALEEHFCDSSPQRVNASGRHPHESAFLTSIFEEPDNDATRLIFADWLEENGQPDKAAYVRLEVAVSRLPKNEKRDESGVRADLVRLDRVIGGHWSMALIRPARNVEWIFRGGHFSSYDHPGSIYSPPSSISRYVLTPDSQRQWRHKQYDSVYLTAEEKAQVKRLNVPEVEDDLAKLPKMPPSSGW